MTREELALLLGRVKQAADQRVAIYRVVIDATGVKGETIYRGSFVMKGAGGSK